MLFFRKWGKIHQEVNASVQAISNHYLKVENMKCPHMTLQAPKWFL